MTSMATLIDIPSSCFLARAMFMCLRTRKRMGMY